MPADLTTCQYTVQGDDPLIIENTLRDERTKDSPVLDLSQLRFYAGVPIKNEAGENIGTFCVQSVLPRSKGSVSEDDLRDWASRAQGEVLKLATDAAPAHAPQPDADASV
jgi:GAF domain-containing protein